MSTRSTYRLKRPLDVCLAAAGLVVLSPLLVLVAVAVKLSSPGPVLFTQERMGRDGVPFRLLKFRSMRVTSGKGPLVTSARDDRITRVGRVLRRYKLDELPQLLNVVRGQMSIVGPRPEVRRYVERFSTEYAEILRVRPGLTDGAALEYRDEEGILARSPDPEAAYVDEILPAKIGLYRNYLENVSLRTDLQLIARTLVAIFR